MCVKQHAPTAPQSDSEPLVVGLKLRGYESVRRKCCLIVPAIYLHSQCVCDIAPYSHIGGGHCLLDRQIRAHFAQDIVNRSSELTEASRHLHQRLSISKLHLHCSKLRLHTRHFNCQQPWSKNASQVADADQDAASCSMGEAHQYSPPCWTLRSVFATYKEEVCADVPQEHIIHTSTNAHGNEGDTTPPEGGGC